jgi:hypothetical protein
VIELLQACYASPYRKKRRLHTVLIPAGAILEHATHKEVMTHMPRWAWVNADIGLPSRVPTDGGAWRVCGGHAVLNTGNVALICPTDCKVKWFEMIDGQEGGEK